MDAATDKIKRFWVSREDGEIKDWLTLLRATPDAEMGVVLALATNLRQKLYEEEMIDLTRPRHVLDKSPGLMARLNDMVREFQSVKNWPDAAAATVWLMTLHCAATMEFMLLGRQIWAELHRGLPYVVAAANAVHEQTGSFPRVYGAADIPQGFEVW